MKIEGDIIYKLHFSTEIPDAEFDTPDCKDTGYVNDWILDLAEAQCSLDFDSQQAIIKNLLQDPNNESIEIYREDIRIPRLKEYVREIRDKFNIPSDGFCD